MTKKIVITGAAGMVAQNLIPILINKNYEVIALDKNKNNLDLLKELNPKAKTFCVDLAKKGKWMKEFKNAYAIIDLKAQIASKDEKSFSKNNIEAQKKIIEACKTYEVKKLIHVSSSVVISVANDFYTKTKRKCEELVHESNIPHIILRPTLMYGCFDVKHLDWVASIMEKTPILPFPGNGKIIRQPLYCIDFCNILIRCVERQPDNKIYNVVGKEKLYFIDLMKKIMKEKKIKSIIIPTPMPFFSFMLKVYTFILRKPTITNDQLTALTAGDIFPIEPWEETFGVKYTKFNEGIRKVYRSPFYKYTKRMISPN
ncbi:MAG: NAD-dependent epimerase/dehydratase family protein [Candidatus Woesearchaeota archaeon]